MKPYKSWGKLPKQLAMIVGPRVVASEKGRKGARKNIPEKENGSGKLFSWESKGAPPMLPPQEIAGPNSRPY